MLNPSHIMITLRQYQILTGKGDWYYQSKQISE